MKRLICTVAIYTIRVTEDLLEPPRDIGVVIDGVQIFSRLQSVAHAFTTLFELVYAINLKYPDQLKYTFEALQKIVIDIEPKKMSRRVGSLHSKLVGV
uniref:Uncharacterized protein n=1 Tax=Nothobranchius korthausae TaxID=1143690 RepID=A0A1A8GVD5_9TELE